MVKLRYLLDTNILSEPLRPEPHGNVRKKLKMHQRELATAAPVWHELVFGCERLPKSKKRSAIETYLESVVCRTLPILPYDQSAAAWHARERITLSKLGKTPSFVDGQIASIAKIHGLIVVTRNLKDYVSFRGVEIQDWT